MRRKRQTTATTTTAKIAMDSNMCEECGDEGWRRSNIMAMTTVAAAATTTTTMIAIL
jgi:hypothetical protein